MPTQPPRVFALCRSENNRRMFLAQSVGDDCVSAIYIEIVPLRGYRFVAQVKNETGPQSFN